MIFESILIIGNRKDSICFHLHGQNSSSPYAAISAVLDSDGRAFVLILLWNYCVVTESEIHFQRVVLPNEFLKDQNQTVIS